MGNTSTYEILGISKEFVVILLLLSLIFTMAPYAAGKNFGIFNIPPFEPTALRRLKALGPLLFLFFLALAIPLWSPLLAQKEYLQALEFLNSKDSNHRLAAVRSFGSSAESSQRYHWLMLEQIPAAIREWAGHVQMGSPCQID